LPTRYDESRWRDLLSMATDFAFEADARGRILHLSPDDVLGWPPGVLVGKQGEVLLASQGASGFNPFRVGAPVRARRAWLNRVGGDHVCLRFTCTPLLDTAGRLRGTLGVGTFESRAEAERAPIGEPAIDWLTGLLNRPAFLAEMTRRVERLDRDRLPGTLICANLDNFGLLNAHHGPDIGDQVLVRVAGLLSTALRPSDLTGRLGGDAFAMWMNGADHMTAAERAEALRAAVPVTIASLTNQDAPMIGVSIGIASRHHGSGETVGMLMRRAERAMQAVKQTGRGHWRVAHVTEP